MQQSHKPGAAACTLRYTLPKYHPACSTPNEFILFHITALCRGVAETELALFSRSYSVTSSLLKDISHSLDDFLYVAVLQRSKTFSQTNRNCMFFCSKEYKYLDGTHYYRLYTFIFVHLKQRHREQEKPRWVFMPERDSLLMMSLFRLTPSS